MRSIHRTFGVTTIVVLAMLAAAGSSVGIVAETDRNEGGESAVARAPAGNTADVVLYYFHGSRRCRTCRSIEAYAREAVEGKFHDALRAGTLQWRPLNTDEPENAHFVMDFGLVSSSLVVVELDGEAVERYEILQDAWTLVRDRPRFVAYVQKSVGEYLE